MPDQCCTIFRNNSNAAQKAAGAVEIGKCLKAATAVAGKNLGT